MYDQYGARRELTWQVHSQHSIDLHDAEILSMNEQSDHLICRLEWVVKLMSYCADFSKYFDNSVVVTDVIDAKEVLRILFTVNKKRCKLTL